MKGRVESYESAGVDMITNQADKQKIWEVMKSGRVLELEIE